MYVILQTKFIIMNSWTATILDDLRVLFKFLALFC